MRILRIDSVGGASGDMLMAALSDLGADLNRIQQTIAGVLPDRFDIESRPVTLNGIRGCRAQVRIPAGNKPHDTSHAHAHPHPHAHPHAHSHAHTSTHHHDTHVAPVHEGHMGLSANRHHKPLPADGHDEMRSNTMSEPTPCHASPTSEMQPQAHRGLREIRALLSAESLPKRARELAVDVFERLAQAEAKIHGTTPDAVHFHEVGAVDAIVDILGACLALHQLNIEAVDVGPLPLGSGCLRCDHGIMPIPAPATAELLIGHPVCTTAERTELVTPTGAAVLMSWKALAPAAAKRTLQIIRSGYGFGARTLESRPNLLRATILEPTEPADAPAANNSPVDGAECLQVIETNLDDCPAEWIGALYDRLPALGALDIWTTPAGMKKSRPGIQLSVLCRTADAQTLAEALFADIPTLGLRFRPVFRLALQRRQETVRTPYGTVRIKIGMLGGRCLTRAPEFQDCLQCAREHGISPRMVYAAALQGDGKPC